MMHIYLTEKGREAFKQLDQASEEQLRQLLGGLSAAEGEKLSQHVAAVMDLFMKAQESGGAVATAGDDAGPGVQDDAGSGVQDDAGSRVQDDAGSRVRDAVTIRTDLRPGDLGYVVPSARTAVQGRTEFRRRFRGLCGAGPGRAVRAI
ncbi:hypothetical protein ACQ86N_14925 [Puia sp. P3]|uniref:hypothetical protein n=1 Tax=Puia sp. P3 TaxID=3423952 RepID=UPI003D666815